MAAISDKTPVAAQSPCADLPSSQSPSRPVSDPPDLDIGVIYTHERDWMPRLLKTMAASGNGLRMRLILVDNASSDGAAPWRGFVPDTLVLRNETRQASYAVNLNRILEASAAPYVLLMNTDMYFDPRTQCLAQMVAFMESQPRCGLAGCRLFHADGHDALAALRFQTLPLILARRCGLSRLFRRSVERHFYADRSPSETWTCDWVSGCFMMVRRKAIEQVGRFDESYWKYFEDVDICFRMAQAGWSVMYHGATSCYHLEKRASKRLFSTDAWLHMLSYARWIFRRGKIPAKRTP
jgi:N-acetylglucosaminyl-diphospho-decaprenol L-rhamnosyltransferase